MTTREKLKKNKSKLYNRIYRFKKTKNTEDSIEFIAKIKRRVIAIKILCYELSEENDLEENTIDNWREPNCIRAKRMYDIACFVESQYCKDFSEISYKYGLTDKKLFDFQSRYLKKDIIQSGFLGNEKFIINEEIKNKLKLTKQKFRSLTALNTFVPFKN